MGGTRYRNFGGSGAAFSRRPPMPRSECSFKGKKITSKADLGKYLSGESIQCLICGDYFSSVSSHVLHKHGVTAKDYKTEFGIPQNVGVVIKSLSKVFSDNMKLVDGMDKRKEGGREVDEYLKERLSDFLGFVVSCSEKKISIYKANKRKSSDVHAFIATYNDKSLVDAVKENSEYRFKEKPCVISVCANKGCTNKVHRFGSHSSRSVNPCCSHSCAGELMKSTRLEKACKTCGRIMLLTKGNYKRISRCCGKRSNANAKNSAINFKGELENKGDK